MIRRIALLLVAALLALPVSAGTTWAPASASSSRSVSATCTTGTESAPTLVTQGMSLDAVVGMTVVAEAASGQTLTGGTLQAYLYNDVSGVWARASSLDLTLSASATRSQTWAGITVTAQRGRIAYLPNGVTISSGSATVYLLASGKAGDAL